MSLMPTTLQEQEEIVERGLASFIEVGNALMRIRDDELYREAGFDGFVAYLDSKPWGISPTHAYRQIDAAKVADVISPNGETIPEGQARELAPLMRKATPEVVKQVYAEVVEETGGKPTAKVIREKVKEILPARQLRKQTPKGGRARSEELRDVVAFLKQAADRWNADAIERTAGGLQIQKAYEFMVEYAATLESMTAALNDMRSKVD